MRKTGMLLFISALFFTVQNAWSMEPNCFTEINKVPIESKFVKGPDECKKSIIFKIDPCIKYQKFLKKGERNPFVVYYNSNNGEKLELFTKFCPYR